jgi:cytochrome c553
MAAGVALQITKILSEAITGCERCHEKIDKQTVK